MCFVRGYSNVQPCRYDYELRTTIAGETCTRMGMGSDLDLIARCARRGSKLRTRKKSFRSTICGCAIVILPSSSMSLGTNVLAVMSKLSSFAYTALRRFGMSGVMSGCALRRMAASLLVMERNAQR